MLFGVHTTPVLLTLHAMTRCSALVLWCFILLVGCESSTKDPAPSPVETEPVAEQTEQQLPTPAPKEDSVLTFDLQNPKTPDGKRVSDIRLDKHNPVLGPEI